VIGNDIVDLTFAKKESNWKRPRFLNKVFSSKEQKLIAKTSQSDQMVWLLWSMKESAYKLHVQLFGKRFFAPKKFACSISNFSEKECIGKVESIGFECFTYSEISDQFIHTIAKSEKLQDCFSQIFSIEKSNYKTQHSEIYRKTITHFANLLGTETDGISIKKNDTGIPFLYTKNQKEKLALSLTHHGNFGAFAILGLSV
jgi:phosphopantetheinyl transferase